jgi:hypothetical protein
VGARLTLGLQSHVMQWEGVSSLWRPWL